MAFVPASIRESYELEYDRLMNARMKQDRWEDVQINEAAGIQKNGLTVNLLDVEKFVRVNNLSEVTNPIFLQPGKGGFTPDGVLSNEIFGVSAEERRQRFAYINLMTHYMYPLAAVKLASYDRTMADCLYARGTYRVSKDGELYADPAGESGPEFLYRVWPKLRVKQKSTETTKTVQRFFEKSRDELFLTKWPVIPAFYRDINPSEFSSSKSSGVLNSKYSSILSYTQSLGIYADAFGNMTRLTQARVQTLLVDIYNELFLHTVKGQPSKFGMLRRSMAGKNLPYTSRLVITAANVAKESSKRVQTKFGYATIPIQYVCAMFMPFMVHELKNFFDAMFLQGGKTPVRLDDGTEAYAVFTESYDENEITAMINKFIHSPASRFDFVQTPKDTTGNRYHIKLTGRFNKDQTTFNRDATYTDIMYVVAERVARDKHVFITRYPMDNINGQNPFRILISTTVDTEPVTIGDKVYEFYPIIRGDPLNAFMNTGQMSNTMLQPYGADFDGDTVSVRPCWTREANEDAERQIRSNSYILNIKGESMRNLEKDFLLTQYNLTRIKDVTVLTVDCNITKPKYVV